MRKKVLIIGMVNSVHFAKWLDRFKELEIDFVIYPSRQYRRLHPLLADLLDGNSNAQYKFENGIKLPLSNYFDFLFTTKWFSWSNKYERSKRLIKLIEKNEFDVIHLVETQSAGYLFLEVSKLLGHCNSKVYLTNWGSDIYYFKDRDSDISKIRSLLEIIDAYSAECTRDYMLARELGFKGEEKDCLPNSASFSKVFLNEKITKTSSRNQIIVKAYGGEFGLGILGFELAVSILERTSKYNFLFYSVTEELIEKASNLKKLFPSNVTYYTVKKGLGHNELIQEFRNSRIYLGCSKSDGISTSFLEALATGAYPIQTDTSCAAEWVSKGASASIVSTNLDSILNALNEVIENESHLDDAQNVNLNIAKKYLDKDSICEALKSFY